MNKSSGNKKVKQILETSKELFWKYGIKRVSVEEICKEAGVSKMTFYKYFSNKDQLVNELLNIIINESTAKYREIMDAKIPYKEKVIKTIHLKMEATAKMSEEFYQDLMTNAHPDTKKFLEKKTRESLNLIMQDYIEAQKRGDIRKDVKPEFIMYFLNHMYVMANDPALIHLYQKPQERINELVNFFFYGILPH